MLHMAVLYEKLIEGCGRNAYLHTAGTDPLIIYSFIKKISSPGQLPIHTGNICLGEEIFYDDFFPQPIFLL